MKRIILTIAMAAVMIAMHAQVRLIAVKGSTTNTVVKTLDKAIEVAKSGDVIYLPGGAFTVSDTINKPVHIIGTGYNGEIPRATLTTNIMGNLYIGSAAQGMIIEGVNIGSRGTFTIKADETILRRCKIHKYVNFNNCRDGQIINCITASVDGKYIHVYNSLIKYFHADNSELSNSIVYRFSSAETCIAQNVIYGSSSSSSSVDFMHSIHNYSAIYGNNSAELAKLFKNKPTNDFFNLKNNYQLTDSIANAHPQLGIYKGVYPWKDGGQPISPHIEENNSYLDVQNQQFKLRVKVKAQSR